MKHRKSGLFLLEIMLTLLIFAVCALICVLIFAKASVSSTHGKDMNNAVLLAQNEIETAKASLSVQNSLRYYDVDLCETTEEKAVYSLEVSVGETERSMTPFVVTIVRLSTGDELARITSAYFAEVVE
mgnify:CR=1 FL=1